MRSVGDRRSSVRLGVAMNTLMKLTETTARRRVTRKQVLLILAVATATAAQAEDCTAVGTWKDNFQGIRTVPATLVGTTKLPYCQASHVLKVTPVGKTGFTTDNRYTGGDDCIGFVETMSFAADCATASGRFRNDDGVEGAIIWGRLGANLQLKLERNSLTTAKATAQPLGGTFAHTGTVEAGGAAPTVALVAGTKATDNPSQMEFKVPPPDPKKKGAPREGGRIKLKTTYTLNGMEVANDRNLVISFGMSCYMLALEKDYGTVPDKCKDSPRIGGKIHKGTVTDPKGLKGTFCASFLANVRLQGSGQLNNGEFINYAPKTKTYTKVKKVTGSDGTEVVTGKTVARDPAIIPGKGVLVDVDGVGNGLLANDKGGAIRGYRLDLFNGAGTAACKDYANPVGLAACQKAQGNTCPERTFK